jgi:hypothetical protein
MSILTGTTSRVVDLALFVLGDRLENDCTKCCRIWLPQPSEMIARSKLVIMVFRFYDALVMKTYDNLRRDIATLLPLLSVYKWQHK